MPRTKKSDNKSETKGFVYVILEANNLDFNLDAKVCATKEEAVATFEKNYKDAKARTKKPLDKGDCKKTDLSYVICTVDDDIIYGQLKEIVV